MSIMDKYWTCRSWHILCLVLSLLVMDTSAFAHAASVVDQSNRQHSHTTIHSCHGNTKRHGLSTISIATHYPLWKIHGGTQTSSTQLSTASNTPRNKNNNEPSSSSSSSRLQQWGRTYMHWLHTKPLLTKSTTAVFVQLIGDMLSQHLTGYWGKPQPWKYDYRRTLCFALLGFFYKAPLLHVMYRSYHLFGEHLEAKYHTKRNTRLFMELLLDQTVGVVVFYTSYFYVYEAFAALTYGRSKFLILPLCLWISYCRRVIRKVGCSGSHPSFLSPTTSAQLCSHFSAVHTLRHDGKLHSVAHFSVFFLSVCPRTIAGLAVQHCGSHFQHLSVRQDCGAIIE